MADEVKGFSFRAMGYSSLSVLLMILAIIFSSDFFLIGSIMIFVLLFLSYANIASGPKLDKRLDRETMFEGEETEVDLEIEHHMGGHLEIFDRIPPAMEVSKGSNHFFLPMGGWKARYGARGPLRGYHALGPTRVRRWDPLWIWYREGDQGGERTIAVFPRIQPGTKGAIEIRRVKERPGAMHLRRIGMGKEFHSIRDYTPTDPFNTINWKAYARTGTLLVNQFEAESVTDAVFIIDARRVTRVGTMVNNPLEQQIRFCMSMASTLLQGSNKVGLVIYGRSVTFHKPRGGMAYLSDVMHILTDVSAIGYDTLSAAITYSLPYLPPESPIFLLSPLSEDPTIRESVKKILARRHPLTIVSPSGIDYEKMVTGDTISPRYTMRRISRDNMIKDLRRMGATVIDWTPERDIKWAIEEVMG